MGALILLFALFVERAVKRVRRKMMGRAMGFSRIGEPKRGTSEGDAQGIEAEIPRTMGAQIPHARGFWGGARNDDSGISGIAAKSPVGRFRQNL
jgi:hypothetical protein